MKRALRESDQEYLEDLKEILINDFEEVYLEEDYFQPTAVTTTKKKIQVKKEKKQKQLEEKKQKQVERRKFCKFRKTLISFIEEHKWFNVRCFIAENHDLWQKMVEPKDLFSASVKNIFCPVPTTEEDFKRQQDLLIQQQKRKRKSTKKKNDVETTNTTTVKTFNHSHVKDSLEDAIFFFEQYQSRWLIATSSLSSQITNTNNKRKKSIAQSMTERLNILKTVHQDYLKGQCYCYSLRYLTFNQCMTAFQDYHTFLQKPCCKLFSMKAVNFQFLLCRMPDVVFNSLIMKKTRSMWAECVIKLFRYTIEYPLTILMEERLIRLFEYLHLCHQSHIFNVINHWFGLLNGSEFLRIWFTSQMFKQCSDPQKKCSSGIIKQKTDDIVKLRDGEPRENQTFFTYFGQSHTVKMICLQIENKRLEILNDLTDLPKVLQEQVLEYL